MTTNRRDFVRVGAATAALAGMGLNPRSAHGRMGPGPRAAGEGGVVSRAPDPLEILILGGTGFIGIHQVEYALARGHEVTLFNRGLTNPWLFPDLEKLRGDRDGKTGDLSALRGRRWDVVIDNSATVVRRAREMTALLMDSVDHYVYTSSSGVYFPYLEPGANESSPVQQIDDPDAQVVDGGNFGGLKALCERTVEAAFQGRSLIIRPVLISGPWDYTDRSIYWPLRMAKGGRILCPGDGSDAFQLIDARDIADFVIRMAENKQTGTYNLVGPEREVTVAEAFEQMKSVAPSNAEFVWVDTDFLLEHEARPWSELTCWFPPRGDYTGFTRIAGEKAWDEGLRCRPLLETARDIIAWDQEPRARRYDAPTSFGRQKDPVAGLASDKERRILEAWDQRMAGS